MLTVNESEYGLVFVVFDDVDVFEITGWEDSKREGFLVSMNHFINDEKYKYCKPDLLTDTILGTYCYGKTIKGYPWKKKDCILTLLTHLLIFLVYDCLCLSHTHTTSSTN